MSVPLYLMMSYAYYEEDKPIASDGTFDEVSKLMLKNRMVIPIRSVIK